LSRGPWGEPTNATEVVSGLNAALPFQYRCALGFALLAGTLPGPEGVALGERLHRWAADELTDVERIAARVAALGGKPAVGVEPLRAPGAWKASIRWLADCQRQTIDALVDAIPADADDAEGEATEHLIEHVIHRKRDVLEVLERALR
jgi:bacterioferritin (cytochrome b1)